MRVETCVPKFNFALMPFFCQIYFSHDLLVAPNRNSELAMKLHPTHTQCEWFVSSHVLWLGLLFPFDRIETVTDVRLWQQPRGTTVGRCGSSVGKA